MGNSQEIKLGVIGCGGFGLFALQHFAQVDGVKLAAMAGTHRDASIAAAKRFGIPDIEDVDKLLQRTDVDLVYIATPPFLHHEQALAALRAGKHVICEKPLALSVEHGVHFFDLVSSWLGKGTVVAAQRSLRPESGVEEQVQCTVRYGQSAWMNFYHGFHQPGHLDRQKLRLVFERGDVTLFEWVPTRIHIHAVADETATRQMVELFPHARLDVTEAYAPKDRTCVGRNKPLDVYQMIELRAGEGAPKMHRYGELLRVMLTDQVAWIRDRTRQRRITERKGRDSLAMAVAADELARS